MPILSAEPDFYPANLWEGDASRWDGERRWWCLHTRSRQEKSTARHLQSRQISYYLPQVFRESRTPAGRRLRSLIPLFPGYLFLLADDRQRGEALKGNHLANVLEIPDQTGLVHDLRQIHQILTSGMPVAPEPTFPVGTRVRVINGPLIGLVGTIVRRRGHRDRFVATVRYLGQGATIELADWQVEQVEDEALFSTKGRDSGDGDAITHKPA
ncbi:transcription termination/antitermination NusG family protein [soil metagenome]